MTKAGPPSKRKRAMGLSTRNTADAGLDAARLPLR